MSTELPALERFRANKKPAIVLLPLWRPSLGSWVCSGVLSLGANRQVKGQQAYPRWALGGWQPGSLGRCVCGGWRSQHAAQNPGLSPGLLPVFRSPVSWWAWQHRPRWRSSHRAPTRNQWPRTTTGNMVGVRKALLIASMSFYVFGTSSVPVSDVSFDPSV